MPHLEITAAWSAGWRQDWWKHQPPPGFPADEAGIDRIVLTAGDKIRVRSKTDVALGGLVLAINDVLLAPLKHVRGNRYETPVPPDRREQILNRTRRTTK